MKLSRPINLNLFTIHFPVPAIVSITHRISGVILFLMLPFLFYLLDYSLNEQGFANLKYWFGERWVQVFIWLFFIPYILHLIAGIRHLLMDSFFGDSLKSGRLTAILTFIISFILIVLLGLWLW